MLGMAFPPFIPAEAGIQSLPNRTTFGLAKAGSRVRGDETGENTAPSTRIAGYGRSPMIVFTRSISSEGVA